MAGESSPGRKNGFIRNSLRVNCESEIDLVERRRSTKRSSSSVILSCFGLASRSFTWQEMTNKSENEETPMKRAIQKPKEAVTGV